VTKSSDVKTFSNKNAGPPASKMAVTYGGSWMFQNFVIMPVSCLPEQAGGSED
jgi:hypothetical protein